MEVAKAELWKWRLSLPSLLDDRAEPTQALVRFVPGCQRIAADGAVRSLEKARLLARIRQFDFLLQNALLVRRGDNAMVRIQ